MVPDGLHSAFPYVSWYAPPNEPPRQTNPFSSNYPETEGPLAEDTGFESAPQLYAASPFPYPVCALASSPGKKKE